MYRFLFTFLFAIALSANAGDSIDPNLSQHLQDISVTIKSKGGEGSGVLVIRKRGNETLNFVWTAGHVVTDNRSTKRVIDEKGNEKTIVEFDDVSVIKTLVYNGRTVGKTEVDAEVIRYNKDEDLAILLLRKPSFTDESAKFYLEKNPDGTSKIPSIGESVVHVGSLLGQVGSNSTTVGIVSQHGRLIEKKVFDQTTATAFPGSSGGGVYLKSDGRYIGMLLRGTGETFNFIAPIRRIETWAKEVNAVWALDENLTVPSDEEIRKTPVEKYGDVPGAGSILNIITNHSFKQQVYRGLEQDK